MHFFLPSTFLLIISYTLFTGPVSVSLKKTAPEITANGFPQCITEWKDSTECFYRQETPYAIQFHQVNLKFLEVQKCLSVVKIQFLTQENDNLL